MLFGMNHQQATPSRVNTSIEGLTLSAHCPSLQADIAEKDQALDAMALELANSKWIKTGPFPPMIPFIATRKSTRANCNARQTNALFYASIAGPRTNTRAHPPIALCCTALIKRFKKQVQCPRRSSTAKQNANHCVFRLNPLRSTAHTNSKKKQPPQHTPL